jgi:DNA polymerase III subunit epsilon
MIKRMVYDLETTGTFYKWHGIHQIAGIIDINGEIKDEFEFKVRPHEKCTIDDDALKVSGVTKEQIMAYPEMNEVYKQLIAILEKYVDKFDKTDKFWLVGFNNSSFDDEFLRAFFWRCGDHYFGSWFYSHSLDMIVLAGQALINERSKMMNFKLATVARKLGIPVDDSLTHDALYDCRITREMYYTINKIFIPFIPPEHEPYTLHL